VSQTRPGAVVRHEIGGHGREVDDARRWRKWRRAAGAAGVESRRIAVVGRRVPDAAWVGAYAGGDHRRQVIRSSRCRYRCAAGAEHFHCVRSEREDHVADAGDEVCACAVIGGAC
jgi:hypothetical protein